MGCLSLLASERSGPFDAWPRRALVNASWHSTPHSQPTSTPNTCASRDRSASTVRAGSSASYSRDARQFRVRPSGKQFAISSGNACESTRTMRKPLADAMAASVAPVDSGSTITTASGLPSLAVDRCFASGLKRESSGGAGGASTRLKASPMAWRAALLVRLALWRTLRRVSTSRRSRLAASDSSSGSRPGSSNVARRGRVVTSPPIVGVLARAVVR